MPLQKLLALGSLLLLGGCTLFKHKSDPAVVSPKPTEMKAQNIFDLTPTPSMELVLAANNPCDKPKPRKEFRELSPREWTAFVAALKKLMTREQSPEGIRPSLHDNYVKLQAERLDESNGYAAFLAFNRLYLKSFEGELQKVDPSLSLPYWDWTLDAKAPQSSPLFTAQYMGGDGQGEQNCVMDGPFAGRTVFYPESGRCFRRQFPEDGVIANFADKERMRSIVTKTKSYDRLRQYLVYAPSGAVTYGIGGDMATVEAANDPIYFLHLAYLDKIWADWQSRSARNMTSVGGMLKNGDIANAQTKIPASEVTIAEVFSIHSLCYSYSNTL